jgi:hypothetical protein
MAIVIADNLIYRKFVTKGLRMNRNSGGAGYFDRVVSSMLPRRYPEPIFCQMPFKNIELSVSPRATIAPTTEG